MVSMLSEKNTVINFFIQIIFLFVSFLLLSNPIKAEKYQDIEFSYEQEGTIYQLSRVALYEKITPIEEKLERKVIIFTAREDLNGDNVPELITKIADKSLFCNEEGCPIDVFAIDSKGPQLIGSFRGDKIEITDKNENSASVLNIYTKKTNQNTLYSFNQGKYQRKSIQEKS